MPALKAGIFCRLKTTKNAAALELLQVIVMRCKLSMPIIDDRPVIASCKDFAGHRFNNGHDSFLSKIYFNFIKFCIGI